jgi:hypothetical protein
MEKLIVKRRVFDDVIADHVRHNTAESGYKFFMKAKEVLEVRKTPQYGGELDTIYVDFGGTLTTAKEFSNVYDVPRKQIVLARNISRIKGRRARLKPVNQDYFWSLLNWNHEIHQTAREVIYNHEAMYGSATND